MALHGYKIFIVSAIISHPAIVTVFFSGTPSPGMLECLGKWQDRPWNITGHQWKQTPKKRKMMLEKYILRKHTYLSIPNTIRPTALRHYTFLVTPLLKYYNGFCTLCVYRIAWSLHLGLWDFLQLILVSTSKCVSPHFQCMQDSLFLLFVSLYHN